MTYYADIAAVRIQSWLARTPKLKGRRGASSLLRDVTDADAIAALLPAGVDINHSAGNVDGVVNLQSQDRSALVPACEAVLSRLRQQIPAVELQGIVSSNADDYFSAYREMHVALARGEAIQWPPVVPDIPLAEPCTYCSIDPGVTRRSLSVEPADKDRLVCADCAARLDAAGRQADQRQAPDVTRRVGLWLGEALDDGADLGFPDDFAELAALGGDTHIATIYIDGNRIGALFDAIANSSGRSKKDLAEGIDAATRIALIGALRSVLPPDDSQSNTVHVPAIAHLVGGDDVLLSLPAPQGWQFTRSFIDAFAASLAEWAHTNGMTPSGSPPSASAGLVIHHKNHPFALVVDEAARALGQAKAAMRGREGAIAWVDVSATGSQIHGPRSSTWLAENWEALQELARVKPAQRYRLATTDDAALRDQVYRMDLAAAKNLLRQGTGDLRDSLSIVRWWNRG